MINLSIRIKCIDCFYIYLGVKPLNESKKKEGLFLFPERKKKKGGAGIDFLCLFFNDDVCAVIVFLVLFDVCVCIYDTLNRKGFLFLVYYDQDQMSIFFWWVIVTEGLLLGG
jgi:hypothetical protein